MSYNGIIHRMVPPYHPSFDGLAENMVISLKQALNKACRSDSIETKIAKFLAAYKSTPHLVTGRAPTELLLGRLPRTRLSLIHPCVSWQVSLTTEQGVGSKSSIAFNIGEKVLLQNLHPNALQKWRDAIIQGPLTYKVIIDDQVRQAHVDHLRPCLESHVTLTQRDKSQTPALLDGNADNVPNPFLFINDDDIDPLSVPLL